VTHHIEVLGFDCAACRKTFRLVGEVAQELGIDIRLEKVSDPARIAACQALAVPAVVIDGKLVYSGSLPSRRTITNWLIAITRSD
jgi:small redox-active disulfide protein 2